MKILYAIKDIAKKLNYVLSKEEKKDSILVVFMSFLEAGIELLGVSVLVPLMQVFVDTDLIINSSYAKYVAEVFHIKDSKVLIILLFVAVALVFVLKNLLAILASYVSARFSCKVMAGLGTRMMQAYMERDYSFFANTNISEIHRGINTDTVRVYEMLNNIVQMIKAVLIIVIFFLYLIYTNWYVALCIVVVSILSFNLIIKGFKRIVEESGEQYRTYVKYATQNVLEAFSGIKEVLILNRRQYFVDLYKRTYTKVQKTQVKKMMAESSPVRILEAILVCTVIAIMTVVYLCVNDLAGVVPTLAIFAYASIRIMPQLGSVSGLVNAITFEKSSLDSVYLNLKKLDLLSQNDIQKKGNQQQKIVFAKELKLQHIVWSYDGSNYVLKELNLNIKKGESIAFIGKSGAGKSTLVDIILGLLVPQQGEILIDGVQTNIGNSDWSKLIGYVPQTNYLLDDTIRRNIAFGIEEDKIDNDKIQQAIIKAQLKEYIDSLPEGVETMVGERGARLSGGQRQRIVIARALYNDPSVLILDEATSALDGETEAAVVGALNALKGKLTIIVVAHRLSTIRKCDHIYEIEDGRAVEKNKDELFN